MGQHKSCRSSSLHSCCPHLCPAWRRQGNLRMLWVGFVCSGCSGSCGRSHQQCCCSRSCCLGCLWQCWELPGWSFALPGHTGRTLEMPNPQVRAGGFKTWSNVAKQLDKDCSSSGAPAWEKGPVLPAVPLKLVPSGRQLCLPAPCCLCHSRCCLPSTDTDAKQMSLPSPLQGLVVFFFPLEFLPACAEACGSTLG